MAPIVICWPASAADFARTLIAPCVIFTPAAFSNNSMARWSSEPTPVVPTVTTRVRLGVFHQRGKRIDVARLIDSEGAGRPPVANEVIAFPVNGVLRSIGIVSRFGVLMKPIVAVRYGARQFGKADGTARSGLFCTTIVVPSSFSRYRESRRATGSVPPLGVRDNHFDWAIWPCRGFRLRRDGCERQPQQRTSTPQGERKDADERRRK